MQNAQISEFRVALRSGLALPTPGHGCIQKSLLPVSTPKSGPARPKHWCEIGVNAPESLSDHRRSRNKMTNLNRITLIARRSLALSALLGAGLVAAHAQQAA